MFKWFANWLEARRIRKEIRAVANIQLREGSVLVFEFPSCLSAKSAARMHQAIREVTSAKAIILEEGMKLAGVIHSMRGVVDADGRPLIGENGKLSAEAVAVGLDGQMTALRCKPGMTPETVEWNSPKYKLKTELSLLMAAMAADCEAHDLAAMEWKRLQEEYGDLAPDVAAAKAKGQ